MGTTLQSINAEIRPDGTVHLLEHPEVSKVTPAVLTFIAQESSEEVSQLSEKALSDWNRDEEDDAWNHLQ